MVGYHDPVRRLIVAQCLHNTYHFDTTRRRWADKTVSGAPRGHDARTIFLRDAVSGTGLLVDLAQGELWSHDPDSASWSHLTPKGTAMPAGIRTLAYFDEHLSVVVVIDDTAVWVYRPSAATKASRSTS